MKFLKKVSILMFLATVPSMMPAPVGTGRSSAVHRDSVHKDSVGETGFNSMHKNAKMEAAIAAEALFVPKQQLSYGQRLAVKTRNALDKVSPFENQGIIDSMAGTKGVKSSDGTRSSEAIDMSFLFDAPMVEAKPYNGPEDGFFSEAVLVEQPVSFNKSEFSPTVVKPESLVLTKSEKFESGAQVEIAAPVREGFISRFFGRRTSQPQVAEAIVELSKESQKEASVTLNAEQTQTWTSFMKAQAAKLPSLPSRLQLKQFVQDGVDMMRNLTNTSGKKVRTELNQEGSDVYNPLTNELTQNQSASTIQREGSEVYNPLTNELTQNQSASTIQRAWRNKFQKVKAQPLGERILMLPEEGPYTI